MAEGISLLSLGASAITGVVTGAIGMWVVGPARERNRLWALSNGVQLRNFSPEGTNHYRIQVHNTGIETIQDAVGYLTLNNDLSDIVNGRPAYEGPGYQSNVVDARVCWAVGGNPYKVDIFPGEKQLLNFAQCVAGPSQQQVVIASELGFGDCPSKPARVCLRQKRYNGTLTIVGKNILSRAFSVEIAVANNTFADVHEPDPEPFIRKWPFVIINCRVLLGRTIPRS